MKVTGWQRLCAADALREGEAAIRFAVRVGGTTASAFVIRHGGQLRGYLNRCAHVAMELDWLPGQVFDERRQWLVCATHGALYEPLTGRCAGGPCAGRGGLRAIEVFEQCGGVFWRPDGFVQVAP